MTDLNESFLTGVVQPFSESFRWRGVAEVLAGSARVSGIAAFLQPGLLAATFSCLKWLNSPYQMGGIQPSLENAPKVRSPLTQRGLGSVATRAAEVELPGGEEHVTMEGARRGAIGKGTTEA